MSLNEKIKMSKSIFHIWLLVFILVIVTITFSMAAIPNYNSDNKKFKVEERFLQEHVSREYSSEEVETSSIANELDIRYRNKIEKRILEIANNITSENAIPMPLLETSGNPKETGYQ